eukprot:CAMPEP_0174237738 /NCGR_PEP_ID=MMETSP0417-20130205/9327_1 /TAXON_ID=242541 /ORGANISM="Mayorella sp, Strain BSH-02190019" /LENGTH=853 /DNA_ID=CAMNT_0015316523 /DNA_START=129 /DNA_END=2688 /DNA_ORIENTATION=+
MSKSTVEARAFEKAFELASQCCASFHQGRYRECASLLDQLQSASTTAPAITPSERARLTHNRVLARFLQSQAPPSRALLTSLHQSFASLAPATDPAAASVPFTQVNDEERVQHKQDDETNSSATQSSVPAAATATAGCPTAAAQTGLLSLLLPSEVFPSYLDQLCQANNEAVLLIRGGLAPEAQTVLRAALATRDENLATQQSGDRLTGSGSSAGDEVEDSDQASGDECQPTLRFLLLHLRWEEAQCHALCAVLLVEALLQCESGEKEILSALARVAEAVTLLEDAQSAATAFDGSAVHQSQHTLSTTSSGGHRRRSHSGNSDSGAAESARQTADRKGGIVSPRLAGPLGAALSRVHCTEQQWGLDADDVRLRAHLCRARLSLSSGDLRSAKRELKHAMTVLGGGSDSGEEGVSPRERSHRLAAVLLKAELEYRSGHFPKAIKLLDALHLHLPSTAIPSPHTSDSRVASLYYNSLGCIHYRQGQISASLLYFSRAISEATSSAGKTRTPLVHTWEVEAEIAKIYYNAGLAALRGNEPELGFYCFQEASIVMFENPRLWHRMAECCISRHQRRVAQSPLRTDKSAILAPQTPVEHLRYLPQATTSSRRAQQEDQLGSPDVNLIHFPGGSRRRPGPAFLPKPSLTAATVCLRNVVLLTAEQTSPSATQHEAGPCFVTLSTTQRNELHRTALLNLAYVNLALTPSRPNEALDAAQQLLSEHTAKLDASDRFLATTYAAEALCLLGRYKEAALHLKPKAVLAANGAESNTRPARPGMWLPTSPATISALHVNLASVHTLSGDLEQAGRCVATALQHCPHFQPAIQLQVYLFLCSDQTGLAVDVSNEPGSWLQRATRS